MTIHRSFIGVLTVFALCACASDDVAGSGGDDYFYDAGSKCPAYVPEMHKGMEAFGAGGTVRGELVSADKIPVGWYHNDWVVRFTDPAGEPLSEVVLTAAKTWMPSHGHDGGQTPRREALSDGEFSVTGLNVTMNGHWEFIFDVQHAGGGDEVITDLVTFHVCNEQPKP